MIVHTFKDLAEFEQAQGTELPVGEWMTVTQEMINDFSSATNDHQWIHTDQERAKVHSPFKTTIAHGFLTLSLVSTMINKIVKINSLAMSVNYGVDHVRFPSPVPVNSRVRLKCGIKKVEHERHGGMKVWWNCKLEIADNEKPACVCEMISLIYE